MARSLLFHQGLSLDFPSPTRYRFKNGIVWRPKALEQYTTTFDPHDFRHFHDSSLIPDYSPCTIPPTPTIPLWKSLPESHPTIPLWKSLPESHAGATHSTHSNQRTRRPKLNSPPLNFPLIRHSTQVTATSQITSQNFGRKDRDPMGGTTGDHTRRNWRSSR